MGRYEINKPLMEILDGKHRRVFFAAVKLANIPGAIKQVSEVLANYKANILSGLHYAPPESKEGIWFFAVDLTNTDVNPTELFNKISSLNVVLSLEYGVKRMGNILFPPFHISLNVLGKGVIIERRKLLAEVYKVIAEEFGSGAEALFYHIGFRAGYKVVDYWKRASGLNGEELITLALEVVKALNWISDYKMIEVDLGKGREAFRVWDQMDCKPFEGKKEKPTSHYFRGITSGYISRVMDKHIVLKEKKCIAVGDPYCEFEAEEAKEK